MSQCMLGTLVALALFLALQARRIWAIHAAERDAAAAVMPPEGSK